MSFFSVLVWVGGATTELHRRRRVSDWAGTSNPVLTSASVVIGAYFRFLLRALFILSVPIGIARVVLEIRLIESKCMNRNPARFNFSIETLGGMVICPGRAVKLHIAYAD